MEENQERKKFQKVETNFDEINYHKLYPKTVIHPFPDTSEYKIKKRTPTHIIHKNDIYVTKETTEKFNFFLRYQENHIFYHN